ncbi:GNAT family N-acetyltransferase [Streptomyces sp. URMC 129]|uniref:GNAT family N-acetyltransferase n=1 Tax=Streptomyces sp. URMC 129 TaxID=3423407 RepID=UPI003F1B53E9
MSCCRPLSASRGTASTSGSGPRRTPDSWRTSSTTRRSPAGRRCGRRFGQDAAREYLSNALARAAAGTRIQLAITIDGLTPLGEVVLLPDEDGRREVELGYTVGRAHRRKGLAARALRVLTGFAHRELAPARVVLRIDRDNVASAAVARAVGYRLTDDEPMARDGAHHRFTLLTWEHAPESAPARH